LVTVCGNTTTTATGISCVNSLPDISRNISTHKKNHAFEECRGLRQVSFPHSVKYIGYQAFYKCRGLREVVIPSSVEYIGEHAFGKYFFFKYLPRAKFPYEEYRTYKNFRIICEKGSAAERYAKENGQTFYLI